MPLRHHHHHHHHHDNHCRCHCAQHIWLDKFTNWGISQRFCGGLLLQVCCCCRVFVHDHYFNVLASVSVISFYQSIMIMDIVNISLCDLRLYFATGIFTWKWCLQVAKARWVELSWVVMHGLPDDQGSADSPFFNEMGGSCEYEWYFMHVVGLGGEFGVVLNVVGVRGRVWCCIEHLNCEST